MPLNLDSLSVHADRQALSDVFVAVRDRLAPDIADAWNASRTAPSPVVGMVKGMEAAYAAMAAADAGDRALIAPPLARVAQQVFEYQWHGKADRALDIVQACRRAAGEAVSGDDPPVVAG